MFPYLQKLHFLRSKQMYFLLPYNLLCGLPVGNGEMEIIKKSEIITTRQTGGLLLAYKAKGLKPRLKSHAFTYVQAYCSLSPAGTTYYP